MYKYRHLGRSAHRPCPPQTQLPRKNFTRRRVQCLGSAPQCALTCVAASRPQVFLEVAPHYRAASRAEKVVKKLDDPIASWTGQRWRSRRAHTHVGLSNPRTKQDAAAEAHEASRRSMVRRRCSAVAYSRLRALTVVAYSSRLQ